MLAANRGKLESLLTEIWWAPSAGMPSPFEQRYEGFGSDMAVAVLNLFQAISHASFFFGFTRRRPDLRVCPGSHRGRHACY